MTSKASAQGLQLDVIRPSYHSEAARFAFNVGQIVERELLHRSAKQAREIDSQLVTLEIIQSCLDETLIADARKQLNEPIESSGRKAA